AAPGFCRTGHHLFPHRAQAEGLNIMKPALIIGIILILIRGVVLAYQQFSYKTQETVLDIGPLKATAERTKTVPLSPILGWVLVVGGIGAVICGVRSKA